MGPSPGHSEQIHVRILPLAAAPIGLPGKILVAAMIAVLIASALHG